MANNIHPGSGHVFTVFASAARTGTPDTEEFELPPAMRQGVFVIDVTAIAATPSVVFKVDGVDRASGKAINLITSAAIVGTGTTVLRINDALTAAANTIVKDVVWPVLRFTATHGDADSITYTMTGIVGN